MALLDELVDKAVASELFTSPRIEADLAAFLREQSPALSALAVRAADGDFDRVYFVGGGGSFANMVSGQWLMDRFGGPAAQAFPSYELTWRDPAGLGPRSLVFLASYSGATEDTLAAMRYANGRGAHTVALVRRRPSPMATEAGEVIDYDSTALYDLPLAAVTVFALELAGRIGSPRAAEAAAALEDLERLPAILGGIYRDGREPALAQARAFLSANLLYCVGAGPLAGLAYKFALTVFMENIRVHGSFIESSELRHGPVEAFERQRPDMVFLVGTDEFEGHDRAGDRRVEGRRGTRPDPRRRRVPLGPPAADAVRADDPAPVVHGLFGAAARDHGPGRAGVHGPPRPGRRGGCHLAVATA